jgi:hypothetical protein
MNVEIGTETPIFLFWEYLFRNIGILSLQCTLLSPGLRLICVAGKGFVHINFAGNYQYQEMKSLAIFTYAFSLGEQAT